MNLIKKSINDYYFKGICLVAGTCIGAGMIGIPVKTAGAGFYLTVAGFLFVWAVMTSTALLFLEVSLSFSGPVNFISITKVLFGKTGKNIAWLICLLFMYSIMAAYASGGASLVQELSPFKIKEYLAATIFLLPFAIMVYVGPQLVSFFNKLLTIGAIISFVALCLTLISSAKSSNLEVSSSLSAVSSFNLLLKSLPLIVITMGYHEIIPPLKTYLKEELSPLLTAIIVGSIIPLIIYIIWELLVLLLIPTTGIHGLKEMLACNSNPSSSLIEYIATHYNNKNIAMCFSCFSFFAFTCSLTGSSWALFDFFADGLGIFKNQHDDQKGKFKHQIKKLFLSFITFVPPIIYAVAFPNGFLSALSLAGAFSAIIMIIYPVIMTWKIRTEKNNINKQTGLITNSKYKAPFGSLAMFIILLFGLSTIIIELVNHM